MIDETYPNMKLHVESTIFGQLVRFVSGNKTFQFPDERDSSLWKKAIQQDGSHQSQTTSEHRGTNDASDKDAQNIAASEQNTGRGHDGLDALVIGWYGPDDPENPQNWPSSSKHLIALQMCLLNFAVYIASSIYVPGEPYFMDEFGVSPVVATLGLSLFSFGYGLGPMLWSPLSEMPRLGRTGIFFWTLLAFILFQLPVGFAPNVTIFLFFRWLTGFCGSPCLATGGGTINDIYPPPVVPYFLCLWSSAGIMGPVFGPIIGGYLAPAMGWRWTIWAFTLLCIFVLVVMFFFFPETSASNILYNRAKRLRKATGNERLKSQTEADSAHYSPKDNMFLLARAFTLIFTEPIILFVDLYAALLYGILFIWFESFPIVFGGIYNFASGEQGLVFFGILVFTAISVSLFLLWIKRSLVPAMLSGNFKPEMVLPPAFIGCFTLPVCLFWFGWSSREGVHWVVPIIGSGLFAIGVVTLFNSVYMYIGIAYAPDAASVFAGAALFRASLGAAFPLFARSLFVQLGIGPGNSLLGGIAVLFIPIPFVFYRYGERIRKWSKHAA
ncbi:major facilitator superfamily domain-containing protein [Truncatella angustata]|uniref:Major facilitator superfamily domain-containing protein n=1 Tax=Truncatella angustata TaxID=152316 RepID=A0A9P8UFQ6_9PEZI|nr:major facilitator superfamily domain-containing protein [Truncatella angustata]KAH6649141.1 major facilitator superfamily domain-containing protein [Truncatella angustata]